jgi:AcrR family transcriptional regulator
MTTVSRQDFGRTNQKRRTRRALIEAAAQLLREGKQPTVAEAAETALVSKATAYRYFPTLQSLLMEAALEQGSPDLAAILRDVPADDAATRFAAICAAIHRMVVADEALFRMMIRATQDQWLAQAWTGVEDAPPLREGRRLEMIDAALAPLAQRLPADVYRRLRLGLCLAVGAEALVVLKDVCGLEPDEALDIQLTVGTSLIASAEREAQSAG